MGVHRCKKLEKRQAEWLRTTPCVDGAVRYADAGVISMEEQIDWDALTFSFTPTDTMYVATCKLGEEWEEGEMMPFGDITISPAAGVLNYGQGLFEGMKAQRSVNGGIVLFRPERNAARLQDGARRLGMPPVPEEMFINAIAVSYTHLTLPTICSV